MSKNVLFTGASGFLGRALVQEFLRDSGDTLTLLVRSDSAEQLIRRDLNGYSERVRFLRGDVAQGSFGIDAGVLASSLSGVSEVWHLAASTSFDASKSQEIERINVGGTCNTLDVARRCPQLASFYHVSTAYVCGTEAGRVPEGFLPTPGGFRNAYERSKHQAELLVRDSALPVTVIRPSILIGDSRDGSALGESRMIYGYQTAIYYALVQHFGSPEAYW